MSEISGNSKSLRDQDAETSSRGGLWNWLTRSFGFKNGDSSLRETMEEIIEEIEGSEDEAASSTPIGEDERVMLGNILKLRHLTCSDVMVPRADIIAVDLDTSIGDLIDMMSRAGHSRLPVFRETLDDVIGMVHIKDVLEYSKGARNPNLASIVRRVLIIAPSMRAIDLLLEMRMSRVHMALIVDEFGGIDGLVTIEDLVEEIVGEIEDEHDTDEGPRLYPRPDGSFIADARCPIGELEEKIGPILTDEERDEDIDTLGGVVFWLADRIPARGELIEHEETSVMFEVLDADPRRIKRLKVWKNTATDNEEQKEG
ncbi:hemolysin C [Kiloniella litopenaei]|uniref:Hemolysin C n=1 Tax=Kiloniella litopenaei TaxID=1549748 RepID=A0A0M2R6A5_9PROT|nr:hemolysin family protein [Kiloniella litopenaei]KKJ77176.1 hemolysin C [Kiloniella litopenaei]